MTVSRWSWMILASALLAIVGFYLDPSQILHWICKPLTTLLILAMVLSMSAVGRYRHGIVLGLLCSTVGDVFLMLPGDWFVHGLVSFLLAHLVYLWAFTSRAAWLARVGPFLLYGAVSALILAWLWPGVPAALRLPVVVYVLALAAMAAQAAAVWRVRADRLSLYAAVGGACFVLSDSLIAVNRFVFPFEASKALILVSYWLAQWLIARSGERQPPTPLVSTQ